MQLSRRDALAYSAAAAISAVDGAACHSACAEAYISVRKVLATTEQSRDRALGLLYGGLIGDALGGPVEFADREKVAGLLPDTRGWPPTRQITNEDLAEWSETLPLFSYEKLRPDPAPYGQWPRSAVAGTVTDDSRHKMVLLRAIRAKLAGEGGPLTAKDLAQAYLDFVPKVGEQPDAATQALCDEGLAEYRLAARWVLGERDEARALPVERLWAGVATCAGQMTAPPLAVAYPGRAEACYRTAFDVNFVDSPVARDITAALLAGMAAVLDPKFDRESISSRWETLLTAIRSTDPYRMGEVPFAGRPLHRYMDQAEQLADHAGKRPAELFRLLETDGRPVYWWDAHFTLLVPLAMLHFCQFNVLAALHLILDFGHDTDSYAQVLGCLAGAVCGFDLFPAAIRSAVRSAVVSEYGEDVDQWAAALNSYGRQLLL